MNLRNLRGLGTLVLALSLLPLGLPGQTSTTATIIGTVTDSTGALVSGATVDLVDTSNNTSRKTTSNEVGQYTLPNVQPGKYKLTVSMTGFRQAVFNEVGVDVAKSYAMNVALEVGAVAEVIEVNAGGGAELQTLDATVGAVIKGDLLLRWPTVNRSASGLLSMQPMVSPARGNAGNPNIAGQVSGARSDQNTFSLDGADATDLTSGTAQYFAGAVDWSGPTPFIPVPLESLEEFRVSTTNPNATFGRSAGGQISMVTKRGSNDIHGTAYWYLQNDNLNSNRWEFNRAGIRKPEFKDNRFGATLGGPLWKNKTFLFGNYEGRRFPQVASVSRFVPSNELKQGILRFPDAAGNTVNYNIRNFDPRGLGLSPVVSRLWNLLPAGNDTTLGDGLNNIGFRAPADNSVRLDFGVARLDHHFSNNWRFYSTYRYATQQETSVGQLDIAGLTGGRSGEVRNGGTTPVEPKFFSSQISGVITPNLISETNLGYSRGWWAYKRINPFPQVSGTAAAIMVAQGTLDSGIDVDTQRARSRIWRDQTYQLSENMNWIRGKHTIQFGGSFRHMPVFHERDDKVIGSLTTPVYEVTSTSALSISAGGRPPTCGGGVTTNCLQSGDVTRWNTLFAASLGLVDKAGVVVTRDSQLNDNPLGTPMRVYASFRAYEMYINDVWRVTPNLTLTAGLTYSIQTPPVDKNQLQTILQDRDTKEPISVDNFFDRRRAAAEAGQVYNPTFAFQPIASAPQKYIFDIDWNNIGPRMAMAWNPAYSDGFLGKLFGNKRTVVRAGYGVTFDRTAAVGVVMLPILGVGFSQTLTCNGPRRDGACLSGSDETTGFRIGVDGSSVRLPSLGRPGTPIVPGIDGETLSFSVDPNMKVGRSQSINLTVQRELPGSLLVEAGYVARISNNLGENYELNSVPYMMKDPASGQTFGQAFDAVANQLRGGTAVGSLTAQPWFENQLRGNSNCTPNCTQYLARVRGGQFQNSQVVTLFNLINTARTAGPVYNRQILSTWVRGSGGESFYSGGFVTINKRFSQGLSFTANYTLAKSLDEYGLNQEYIGVISNPFDLSTDWGPALWDRRHVFNAGYFYDLPFGRGKKYAMSNPVLERIAGGWYTSGIYTASSGLPLLVGTSAEAFGGAQAFFGGLPAGALPARSGNDYSTSVNHENVGSGGVGTAGGGRGSKLNIFANPEQTYNTFRYIQLSQDGRHGRGIVRGLARWNYDLSIGKKTRINERIGTTFTFDMINAFNHVEFNDPATSYLTRPSFGVLTSQFASPRQIQFGLRFEF